MAILEILVTLSLFFSYAVGLAYDRSLVNTKRQSPQPEYKCEPVAEYYQYCYPVAGMDGGKWQAPENVFGGHGVTLSRDEYPGNLGSNRYNFIIEDINEIVNRQDLEISPYGTNGINLRIAEGRSFAQTWTITGTGGIQPQGIGATLAFGYAETYTSESNVALSCDVTTPFGVFVVSPTVNHRGGWVIQTDNIAYPGYPDQVVTKVLRWDTDIPLKEVGGFVQGIYSCCGGNSIPFPCCFGSCSHVGGTLS